MCSQTLLTIRLSKGSSSSPFIHQWSTDTRMPISVTCSSRPVSTGIASKSWIRVKQSKKSWMSIEMYSAIQEAKTTPAVSLKVVHLLLGLKVQDLSSSWERSLQVAWTWAGTKIKANRIPLIIHRYYTRAKKWSVIAVLFRNSSMNPVWSAPHRVVHFCKTSQTTKPRSMSTNSVKNTTRTRCKK